MTYPWYCVTKKEDSLLQGDFINDCPIVIPPQKLVDDEVINVKILKYNTIVMSQSCDLIEKKIDLVLVCPIWPLETLKENSDIFKSSRGREALKRGNMPGYHLLNKCEIDKFKTDYLVVDFRAIYGVSMDFIREFATREKRLRLLPPYREHLSQAFARFFMRVGLPIDIPSLK